MAVYTDYFDLQVAVVEMAKSETFSDVMDRLTLQAESYLNKKLRHREMLTTSTIAMTSGVGALPSDFIEFTDVRSSKYCPLYAADIKRVRTGDLNLYNINGTVFEMYNHSGSIDIEYYAKLPTLTTSATTSNWLLQQEPLVYLYAVLKEAAIHLSSLDLAAAADGQLNVNIDLMEVLDERARFSNTRFRAGGHTP